MGFRLPVASRSIIPAVNAGCQALRAPQLRWERNSHSKEESWPLEQGDG